MYSKHTPQRSSRIAAKNQVQEKTTEDRIYLITSMFEYMLQNIEKTTTILEDSESRDNLKNSITEERKQIENIRLPYKLSIRFYTATRDLMELCEKAATT